MVNDHFKKLNKGISKAKLIMHVLNMLRGSNLTQKELEKHPPKGASLDDIREVIEEMINDGTIYLNEESELEIR